MSAVRLRRLSADYDQLADYVHRHPRLRLIQTEGSPPERYQLEYRVRGLRQQDDEMQEVMSHLIEIHLPRNYPRTPPQCRMLTPVFHPNIAPHAICVGDHWSAGEPLWALVARVGEMITFQSYNTKSPLNGDAARWVDKNRDRLPLDPVSMLVEDPPDQPPVSARPLPTPQPQPPASPPELPAAESQPESAPPVRDMHSITCSGCQQPLQVPIEAAGRRVRCKTCLTVLTIPRDLGR